MSTTTSQNAIDKVWSFLDQESDYAQDLTQRLVRIPSVNPKFQLDPAQNKEAAVQDAIQSETEAMGLETERWEVFPDRPNLISELPGGEDRSLILCGHVDVVPIGRESDWTVEPFGGEIANGRLYGRGAVDMKSGVAACIAATRALIKCGIELDGRVSIHTVVDEEAGGFGAMDAVKRGKIAKAAIIAEPTWGDILPSEGGLYWARVTIRGRQGHAGLRFNEIWPQHDIPGRTLPGINAIELSTRFLAALREFESIRCRTSDHPLMPAGLNTINPGVIRGGVGLGPDGLPIIMTNPAIIPDAVVIDLDYKFLPQEDPDAVRKEFEDFLHHFSQQDRWLRDHPVSVEWKLGGLYFPPMDTPVDHPLVTSLSARMSQIGRKPEIKGFPAVCDGAHYAGAGVMPAIFGPSGDGFHGNDEYVELKSLHETTKVIAASIIDWCGLR